ncbi:1,6-anhydro-N-acetylmuramyl-L-alanine amidase AmpD [Undibacterium sp.]|uniref:1,6-anhydro-N-acetylmuramyl-L-alanine amidase AmpD n=1 Tax=Undibacterium sp. TaxID=1914977 RepID=UPI0025CC93ED|nr:1,6-anhydro-N-acetylmuramyl-L-alanine amidase AmpD [Undibacterium sp.]
MMLAKQGVAPKNRHWSIDQDGWCAAATRLPSPNYGERPAATDISLIVLHNISLPAGQFGGGYIQDLFLNRLNCDLHPSFNDLRELKVSAHFLILRDGSLLQCVSTLARAWHAGVSAFEGRSGCNDFSIGIELEGSDDIAFEAQQYQTLAALCRALLQRFAIQHIVGHNEIAPGRKTDPGPCFDWQHLQTLLQD